MAVTQGVKTQVDPRSEGERGWHCPSEQKAKPRGWGRWVTTPSSLINFNGTEHPGHCIPDPCHELAVPDASDTKVKDTPYTSKELRCELSKVMEPHERDMSTRCNLICVLERALPGLLWWLNGKECTYQRRRHGFDPWSGKLPHAVQQLSPCATTPEPALEPESRHHWVHLP